MLTTKKKEGATAGVKLKTLQWDKLNYMSVGNTVWGSGGVDEDALQKALGESGIFGSMEQLFVARVMEHRGKLRFIYAVIMNLRSLDRASNCILFTSDILEPRASKKAREILIVEQRRAHQINLMLGGMKHTNPEIRQAIFRMDEEFMSLVQLTNLLKFVPEAEEVMKRKLYEAAYFTTFIAATLLITKCLSYLDWKAFGVQGCIRRCETDPG